MSGDFQEKIKTFTFIGFSGCGKTTLSQKLSHDGFLHYSVDYEIAHTYLKEHIKESVVDKISEQSLFFKNLLDKFAIKFDLSLNFDDLELITTFVIPINNKGKVNYGKLKYNQNLYKQAELLATFDFVKRAKKAFSNYKILGFVNDATGSICEATLNNQDVLRTIKENSRVIFFKTNQEHIETLIQRSKDKIKPMLYDAIFLESNLKLYYKKDFIDDDFEIDKEFFLYIFPKLIKYRETAYKNFINQTAGISIDMNILSTIGNVQEFLNILDVIDK